MACGVWPLSTIQSTIARIRYGRRESSANSHLLLDVRQAEPEAGAGEDSIGVLEQSGGILRKLDVPARQAPEDRGDGRIHQRELVAEEVRLQLEDLGALQDQLPQVAAQLRAVLAVALF